MHFLFQVKFLNCSSNCSVREKPWLSPVKPTRAPDLDFHVAQIFQVANPANIGFKEDRGSVDSGIKGIPGHQFSNNGRPIQRQAWSHLGLLELLSELADQHQGRECNDPKVHLAGQREPGRDRFSPIQR